MSAQSGNPLDALQSVSPLKHVPDTHWPSTHASLFGQGLKQEPQANGLVWTSRHREKFEQ
jgi:hypothetical protein